MRAMTKASASVVTGLLLTATASAANHVVTANSNRTFTPATLTIAAGDTVTFQNGGGFHNARSDPGAITMFRCANGCDGQVGGNGNLSSNAWTATVSFPTAGTIRYFCDEHGGPNGVGMSGLITVTAPAVVCRANRISTAMATPTSSGATSATARNVIWRSAASTTTQAVTAVSLGWRAVGVGDYDATAAPTSCGATAPTART
jgi:plastocyanin